MSRPGCILWDLDGTLTSPQAGIVKCIQYALERSGRPVPSEQNLVWCIGPPLHQSFARLAPEAGEKEVWELVALYRERFATTGLFENSVYPGIPELLRGLGDHRHFVATSKPEVYARRIVEHFGLGGFFEEVYGSELSGERSDKGELLRHLLLAESIGAGSALMVGDREHDVLGAKKAGIPCVGVLWGYGSREELVGAGAREVVASTTELLELLRGA